MKPIKRGNKWTVLVDVGCDAKGKRLQKYISANTKVELEKKIIDIKQKYYKGETVKTNKMLFKDYMNTWIEDYAKSKLAYKTYISYKQIIKTYILPYFNKIEIYNIKPFHIQEFYSYLSKKTKLSNTSILYIHKVLHKALNQAVKLQIIEKNQSDLAEPPKKNKYIYSVWDYGTIQKFINISRDTEIYIPYILAVTTGMRIGEVLALTWGNVDLEKNIAYVKYTLQKCDNSYILKQPKTKKSTRNIVLMKFVVEELKSHKIKQKESFKSLGIEHNDNTLINSWSDNRPKTPDYVWHKFKKLVEKNDLPKIRLHDLRHSCATMLLKEGIHPKIVSDMLGHSSINLTMDIYSHVLPQMQKEAINLYEKNLFEVQK